MGTLAIGLVAEEKKKGLFIDDRVENVLKYIAFDNGDGGIIKLNKGELYKGRLLGLTEKD